MHTMKNRGRNEVPVRRSFGVYGRSSRRRISYFAIHVSWEGMLASGYVEVLQSSMLAEIKLRHHRHQNISGPVLRNIFVDTAVPNIPKASSNAVTIAPLITQAYLTTMPTNKECFIFLSLSHEGYTRR